jgi:hypothetical protein
MDSESAEAAFDLFVRLNAEEQTKFIKMLGGVCPAEAPFMMTNEMTRPEKERFSQMVFDELHWRFFPFIIHLAVQVLRKTPDATDVELEEALRQRSEEVMREHSEMIDELQADKLKAKRDRKSDPDTVRRNVQICDLRRSDKKLWSLGRLAKKFKVSIRLITKTIKEEPKWRRLAAQQGRTK